MIDRLERLLNLVIALRETRRPMPLEEIRERVAGYGQAQHEAARRMFERDKADLRALGVPIDTAAIDAFGDLVGYRIDPRRYDLPPLALEPDEVTALALALDATGLGDAARSGLRKLAVDAGEPDRAAPVAASLAVDLEAPHRDALLAAQASRTPVRFRYRPADKPARERTVDPYALVHRAGRWYLVGRDHGRDAERAFRLDRIISGVETAGEPGAFADPPLVGIESVVPSAPQAAERSATVLAGAEADWQVRRRAGDFGGGLPVEGEQTAYTVPVGEEERFVAWVLELGADVEVTEPAPLRARVIEALTAIAEAHA